MTLNITLLTEETIYQSADFRLTNLDKGCIQSDTSTKLVVLQYAAGDGFVSYTGIGQWHGRDTSEYIVEWLTGTSDASPNDLAQVLRAKGTDWLHAIEAEIGRQRHTFILAAFQGGVPRVWVISNFEDLYGRNDAEADPALSISSWQYAGHARVIVTGAKAAVQRAQRRRIEHLLEKGAHDPGRIRRALADVNAEAAASARAQETISPECSVVSFRVDGQGFADINGPVDVRTIANGTALPNAKEVTKLLGRTAAHIVGATFASSKPRVAYAPCRPTVVAPTASGGYGVREITSSDLASCRALDVNEVGIVLGAGNPTGSPGDSVLWTSSVDGPPVSSTFLAYAGGINSRGQVAAKAVMSDHSERAIRWDGTGGTPEDLGCFRGRDSGARAINDAGLVAGWVCIDTVNRGQANFRPAAWPGGSGSIRVLEDLGGDGGEAVGVNAAGIVLVVTLPGNPAAPVRALLWNPATNSTEVVGGAATGVFPMAVTDQGIVLGTARDAAGDSVAGLARPGQRWEQLGTPPGFYATAMNDRGEVVGTAKRDRYEQPWLRSASGEITWLPYFEQHWCRPSAISNTGIIVGYAQSDHGMHALAWVRSS